MHYPSDSVAESVCLRHGPGITHILYKSDPGPAGKLKVGVRWADNAGPIGTEGQLFSPNDRETYIHADRCETRHGVVAVAPSAGAASDVDRSPEVEPETGGESHWADELGRDRCCSASSGGMTRRSMSSLAFGASLSRSSDEGWCFT